MENSKILVSDVCRIVKIFNSHNWFTKLGNEEVHQYFIEMLENFTEPQKELIFELSERYTWITVPEYVELLLKTLSLIENEKLKDCKRIILFPIVKPKDIGKVKSSSPLLYLFKATHFGGDKYKTIVFKVIDSYVKIEREKFADGDILFLVDDYVGSGDTLKTVLTELEKNSSLTKEKINVVSLVIQEEISLELGKNKISYYTLNIRKKGISDYYIDSELENKIALMKEIETLIPNLSEYSFGYKESEALVTMNRTPNNTFPIFWKNHKKGGKVFKAPFSR